jgi:hypothetical protein
MTKQDFLELFYQALGRKAPADLRPRALHCDPVAEAALLGFAALDSETLRIVKYLCPPQCFRSEASIWYKQLLELGGNWREKVHRQEGLRFLTYITTWNDLIEAMSALAWQRSAPRPCNLQPLDVITALCSYIREIAEKKPRGFVGGVRVRSQHYSN